MKYKEIKNDFGEPMLQRIDDDGLINTIPMDPDNRDYRAYLEGGAVVEQEPIQGIGEVVVLEAYLTSIDELDLHV